MLSLGIPMLKRPAPRAPNAPTSTAPSNPATIHTTTGPAAKIWSEARNHEESRAEQEPPQTSPERPNFAPILHTVASVVVANRLLILVIPLPNDRQLVHVNSPALKLLHCLACFGLRGIYRN